MGPCGVPSVIADVASLIPPTADKTAIKLEQKKFVMV